MLMNTFRRLARPLLFAIACLSLAAGSARAEGPYRNRDSKDPNDLSEGTYPVPYQRPSAQEITATLQRVLAYLEQAAPARVIDAATGREITDFTAPVAT